MPVASATPTHDILVAVQDLFPTQTPIPAPTIPAVITAGKQELRLVPGTPRSYLGTFRLVAYYGHPASPELGILGQSEPELMLEQLSQLTAQYQELLPGYVVLPSLNFVSTIADAGPGEQGYYRRQTETAVLSEWIEFAHQNNLAFIIDLQPGQADVQAEFERIFRFLYYPHVHLALDPEFMLGEDQVPGQVLGTIHAQQINAIQSQLNEIALALGLSKVLIIHQFDPSMVQEKNLIIDFPYVELVFNADGFGAPRTKINDLQQFAGQPGWEYGGLKLFYAWDEPLLMPAEVIAIEPQPVIVVYQ